MTRDGTQSLPEDAPRTRPQAPDGACGRSRVIPIPQVKKSPWLLWTGIRGRRAMRLPASGLVKCPFVRGCDKGWHSSVACAPGLPMDGDACSMGVAFLEQWRRPVG